MAARENQGLQIAVMIFFLLVVLLAVSTYVFFKNSTDTFVELEKVRVDILAVEKRSQSALDEVSQLRKLMGFNPEADKQPLGTLDAPEPGSILATFNEDMVKYGTNMVNKDYREVLALKHETLLAAQAGEKESKIKEVAATTQFKDVESTKDAQVVVFRQDATKAGTDLTTANDNFKTTVDKLDETKTELAGQLEAKRNQMDEQVTTITKERDAYAAQVVKLTQLNKTLVDRLSKDSKDPTITESPDGEVTWVNQRTRVVWINLGSDDRLERQTAFSVFPVDTNDSPDLSRKKGNIEVTRILDGRMAEARIVDDNVADPILPGDKIISPVWDRGRSEGFALAGFMDVDGDGRSDRNKVRELIKQNGGRIDAEVDDNGKLTGKIEINTRYIILGDAPNEKTTKTDLLENFSKLTGDAQDLTVEKITVQKFLQQMGFRTEERTVPLGRGARPEDFTAKPADGVNQRSTGNTSESFKPREAPKKTTF
jgi:hypothetical protein